MRNRRRRLPPPASQAAQKRGDIWHLLYFSLCHIYDHDTDIFLFREIITAFCGDKLFLDKFPNLLFVFKFIIISDVFFRVGKCRAGLLECLGQSNRFIRYVLLPEKIGDCIHGLETAGFLFLIGSSVRCFGGTGAAIHL